MSVVLLAGPGESTWYVCNALHRHVGLRAVIVEGPVGDIRLLKSRARKLGWSTAIGQAAFIVFARLLCRRGRGRSAEIKHEAGLCAASVDGVEIINVASVNDIGTIDVLRRLQPRVVVVNGTRIISSVVLSAINAVFINMHAGITPKYRGVHGGYWALFNGDRDNAGVTVHLVDAGVDTGGILYQARIHPGPRDNFCTYPLLQLAAGIPLLVRAVADGLADRVAIAAVTLPSHQYYHPTLLQYLMARLLRGVK